MLGPLEKAGGQAPKLLILAPRKHLQQWKKTRASLQGLLVSSYPQSLSERAVWVLAISRGLGVRRPCIGSLEPS